MVPKTNSSSSGSSKQGDFFQRTNDFVISRTPDQSHTARYLHLVTRASVAKICQEVGWDSAQMLSLDVLTDLFVRHLKEIAKTSTKYTEHCGRTLVNQDDVALGFKDMNISASELEEYVQNFDPYVPRRGVLYFPAPRKTDLNFLRPGSSEVLTRPVHVHEYMPPMIFEAEENEQEDKDEGEEEEGAEADRKEPKFPHENEEVLDGVMNGHIPMQNGLLVVEEQVPEVGSELVVAEPVAEVEVKTETKLDHQHTPIINNDLEDSSDDEIEPASAKAAAVFATFKSTKKLESASENAALKRVRKRFEEFGHPVRCVTSVIMVPSGYLSESREGRLPESRAPPQCRRDFFDTSPPPMEKKLKIPTMKKILEGVKKMDHRHSDDGEDVGPGLFDSPDKIVSASSGSALHNHDGAVDRVENGENIGEVNPKRLSKQERKLLSQKQRRELKSLKKIKLKVKKEKGLKSKKLALQGIEQGKESVELSSAPSKDKNNKLTIFTKNLKTNLTPKQLEKQQRRKEKKLKSLKLKEVKVNLTPLEEQQIAIIKPSTSAGGGVSVTEPIESDEDFSSARPSESSLAGPSSHMVSSTAHQPMIEDGALLKKKMKKDLAKLKPAAGEAPLFFDAKHQKKAMKGKGLTIAPTMLPPIPKLTNAKIATKLKRPISATGLSFGGDIPMKKKRGRPKKIFDTSNPVIGGGAPMCLQPAQISNIGKSLMIKEPKFEPPIKVMKIRKEHMEPVQDMSPLSFPIKPPSNISPKPPSVSSDLLKRLPAQPGLIPEGPPVSGVRFPKELPPSISITPAAISPAKDVSSVSRNFGGSLPPNVCSSVTITRIDMTQQHKLPSPSDDSFTPGIGPPMLGEKRTKLKGVPPPPPLQMPVQTETESGITITPILMKGYELPPPPPLKERPQQKPSMLAKLDEELSSKEQRKKDKEKRKELKKEKKKKAKDKERSEKKDKDKSEKKKKKKEKTESGEPPVTSIPKLTLKLSGHSSNTPTPVDSPNPPQVFIDNHDQVQAPPVPPAKTKLTIKPIDERRARSPSPDLQVARFSPLVTRPPKPGRAAKAHAAAGIAAVSMGLSMNQEIVSFPPMSKDCGGGGSNSKRGRGRPPKGGAAAPTPPSSSKAAKPFVTVLETETVGCITDELGNKIWICPACGRQDDGSPMIGCDLCDDWYHFPCVGIVESPDDDTQWFCQRCLKKQKEQTKQKKRSR